MELSKVILRCLCTIVGMSRFETDAELEAFLCKLDPDYAQYALALWQKGVRTSHQLSGGKSCYLLVC